MGNCLHVEDGLLRILSTKHFRNNTLFIWQTSVNVSLETSVNSASTAIILLAGNAPRYMDAAERMPCGLLEVNGLTLLQCAVERLLRSEFTKIIIVTGHWPKHVQNLTQIANVEIMHDVLFADFGSMFALRRIASQLTSYPLVLVESGILFESRLALLAKTMQHANGVVVSSARHRGNGVFTEGINNRLLTLANRMSSRQAVDSNLSRALGIYKISRPMFAEMLAFAAQRTYTDPFLDYIDCIDGVAHTVDIRLEPAPDLLWAQISSRTEMVWALKHLYPRIMQQESQPR